MALNPLFTQIVTAEAIAVFVCFAIAAAIAFGQWLMKPRPCYVCNRAPAVMELADFPLCRNCWETVDRQARLAEALEASPASKEIEEWYRRHPNAR